MSITIYFPHKPANGGPGTFQLHLENYLKDEGWEVCYDIPDGDISTAFIVGGTDKILTLLKLKWRGVKIIHRLDGILYSDRLEKRTITSYMRMIGVNLLLNFIRKYLADYVVYQTEFVKKWWHLKYGNSGKPEFIIPNGSSNNYVRCDKGKTRDVIRVICVEGHFPSDTYVIDLLKFISALTINGKQLMITMVGEFEKSRFSSLMEIKNVNLLGRIPREKVASILVENDIFLSLDLNAACPNSVIEAMHAGLPIVGFDTGSLSEICDDISVKYLVPFEGDPFRHDYTGDFTGFKNSIANLEKDLLQNSSNTLKHAKDNLSSQIMIQKYMNIIQSI